MPTLLDMIEIEIENMDPDTNPDCIMRPALEVNPNDEHVVGKAEMKILKMFSLACLWEKTSMEMIIAARFMGDRAEANDSMTKAAIIAQKSEILKSLVWASIKDSHNLWDKPIVGLRRNWEIVWSEPQTPSINDILGGFLGR